ncbi:MAG: VOC family protein [Aerococcaceae bacterium]|nr:VOC family protein [Aerococcaceae bacterium]
MFKKILFLSALFGMNGTPVSAQNVPQTDNPLALSSTHLVPSSYQLNALDAPALANFYVEKIGLTLIEEVDGVFRLGTPDQTVLLEIFPTDVARETNTTGLYHTAFLLENREHVLRALKSLLKSSTLMQGSSDHAVSEALYLLDPEGNGIEIYADRPREQWTYDENGYVQMGNAPFDAQGVLQLKEPYEGLTNQSKIGHFHLSVNTLADTQTFYHDLLGLGVTAPEWDGGALFLATDFYHHHLGTNVWMGEELPAPTPDQQGIRAVVWQTNVESDLETIQANLTAANIDFTYQDNTLEVVDNSGILLMIKFIP